MQDMQHSGLHQTDRRVAQLVFAAYRGPEDRTVLSPASPWQQPTNRSFVRVTSVRLKFVLFNRLPRKVYSLLGSAACLSEATSTDE